MLFFLLEMLEITLRMLHNNVEIFMHLKKISRRELLKKSISSLPFLALPNFSFSQSSFDVVVIGAGASGLSLIHI